MGGGAAQLGIQGKPQTKKNKLKDYTLKAPKSSTVATQASVSNSVLGFEMASLTSPDHALDFDGLKGSAALTLYRG